MIKQSIFLITALLVSSLCFTGCSDDDDDYLGNWVDMGDFSGKVRSHAVTFTIDDKVYLGTGYDYDDDEKFSDFWQLTVSGTSFQWTQVESLPGLARNRAVAFASETSGYVGLGSDEDDNFLSDFYKYTPGTGWEEMTGDAAFPGTARKDAVAFFVDSKGYVGTGEDDDEIKNDFYAFNPSTSTWEAISTIKSKRTQAMSFVLGGNAYVISGYSNGSLDDFFRYDTSSNTWVELNRISDFTDYSFDDDYDSNIQRYDGVAFTMGGKAYLATGNGSAEVWEWNPTTDRWKQKTDFEGSSRYGAVAFTLNDVGYLCTGGNGSYSYDDMWYFEPYEEYENKD